MLVCTWETEAEVEVRERTEPASLSVGLLPPERDGVMEP
jgi:hypothetical protein